ncbi:MAG: bifunctional UDP-N-acetylglucosamine pyrophosphorylase/glucosamine-1-phosphate N-acetyltransferase [Planctomycetota bacterium]|jgi:bifunctional UDP-N-acetylglucosamine pyrophosphorylase/glucosamine-1-phosphate N-acetyltransferase
MASGVSLVILAAGKGTRMKSALPKVLHPLCGRSMLGWVMQSALAVDPDRVVIVVGHGAEAVQAEAEKEAQELGLRGLEIVVQEEQKGTGHAVQVAAPALGPDPDIVLVLAGDMPLIRGDSIEELVRAQKEVGSDSMVVLTAELDDPHGYGRIVRDANDALHAIVEQKDASAEQLEICETNTGVYAFSGKRLLLDLPRLGTSNAQGEYYLTDLVGLAVDDGRPVVTVVLGDAFEGSGVNDLRQLAIVRQELQFRILDEHMAAGVAVTDPGSAYVDHGVTIGEGTMLLPCVMIHRGVQIGKGCEVGPFAQLRPGTVMKDGSQVGNFTECKNSEIGEGSKAKHLSYLGDAKIGKKTNIGAGTIFANYDGTHKHPTQVGDGVSIGSGSIIVAPNNLPDGLTTGAGAVITRDASIQAGETWVGMPAKPLRKKNN